MGGGFGSSTINLVASAQVEAFGAGIRAGFAAQFGYEPALYVACIVAGVSTLPSAVPA